MERVYACIDLKSFYASVECRERGLDPLVTNLVVADSSRTEKTICLAVTPSLKQYGLSGRSRLFEVVEKVKSVNYERYEKNGFKKFLGKSFNDEDLKNDYSLELSYIIAPPRMSLYMEYSQKIYSIYLKYISSYDIYPYSIDEVFCDITHYLKLYKKTPEEVITMIIKDVYDETGITATAGIGSNMYLAKIAMDIVAKHMDANEFGVRMAYLNEKLYREKLWDHSPLTDFWRVGRGISKKLEEYGMYTMGDVARVSLKDEDLLFKLFGVNAELLIDHAWGYEPTTLSSAKNYKPDANSLSSGQVLHEPYNYQDTKLIVKEMMELLSLDLVDKDLVTDKLVLTIGYDIINLTDPKIKKIYDGEITFDMYGRKIPKHSHGTINIEFKTSSTEILTKKIIELYERIVNPFLLIRRINIVAVNTTNLTDNKQIEYKQIDLFSNVDELEKKKLETEKKLKEENSVQKVMLDIKRKYGKNSILKGMNLEKKATTMERNEEIGGHKA